jgi:hypothetical protein
MEAIAEEGLSERGNTMEYSFVASMESSNFRFADTPDREPDAASGDGNDKKK